MVTTIYVDHKPELDDYVTNIALICFDCKYILLKKTYSKCLYQSHLWDTFWKIEIIWSNQLLMEEIYSLTAGQQKPHKRY